MEVKRPPAVALYGQVEGAKSTGRQTKHGWRIEGRPKGARNEHERSCEQKQELKDVFIIITIIKSFNIDTSVTNA